MAYIDGFGTEFSEDKKKLIKFTSDIRDYSIPEGTEEIAVNAFKDNKTLKVLHLPSTIRLIESYAFSKSNLEEIHFAGDIEQWLQITWKSFFSKGYNLYFNEDKLVESIIIPESITIIKELAFFYCKSLHSVIFNKNITAIGKDAFNKSGLSGILSIPKSCESIGDYSFFFCTGITKVKIPEQTKEIGTAAFSACYALKSFVVSKDNTNFFTDGTGLYLNKPINGYDDYQLIALASGKDEKYTIHKDASSIATDTCCFNSVPKGGLVITKHVSIKKDAFRETRGKIFAPILIRWALIHKGGLSVDKFIPIFHYDNALIEEFPTIIAENPFRVLGVYVNANQKEIQSSAAKIKRFLEIGKQPSFPTDFNNILPKLERTSEMVDKALSQISQPKEKLANALFWFSKPRCELHQKAEDLLKEGKTIEASNLLSDNCGDIRTTLAPYICLACCENSLSNDILEYANVCFDYINRKEYFDIDDKPIKLESSLLDEICGNNFIITKEECQKLYFDSLMTFLEPLKIWACVDRMTFSKEIKDHLFNKSIGQNIDFINAQIASTELIDKKNTSKLLKATKELKDKTIEQLLPIDEYLSSTDVRLVSIHDALSKQILQSAIDCYNHADNRDIVAREVYSLMTYAKKIAKGELLKNRCDENIKTIKEHIDDLPPEGLEDANKKLFAAVTRARNSADTIEQAKALLKEAEPYLFKINLRFLISKDESRESNEKIRNLYRQGVRNGYETVRDRINILRAKRDAAESIQSYFKKVSTIIANVCLNKLIEDVNSTSNNRSRDAWPIITALNQLPLDVEFKKNRYDDNVETLIKNILLSGIKHDKDEISYDLIDLRPEHTVWQYCRKRNDYRQYIKRFPNGAHIKEAKELQEEINRKNAEQRRLQEAENARKRLIEEVERAKKAAEEEKRRQIEIEELYRQEKIERESKFLNWVIGILIIFIVFEVLYLFLGWVAALGICGAIVLFGVIILMFFS